MTTGPDYGYLWMVFSTVHKCALRESLTVTPIISRFQNEILNFIIFGKNWKMLRDREIFNYRSLTSSIVSFSLFLFQQEFSVSEWR